MAGLVKGYSYSLAAGVATAQQREQPVCVVESHAVADVPSSVHSALVPIGQVMLWQVPIGHVTSHAHDAPQLTRSHASSAPHVTSHAPAPHSISSHAPEVLQRTMHESAARQSTLRHALLLLQSIVQ
jgi:hypothetical protein